MADFHPFWIKAKLHPAHKLTYEAVNTSIVQVILMESSQNASLTNMHRIFVELRVYQQARGKKNKEKYWLMINVSIATEKVLGHKGNFRGICNIFSFSFHLFISLFMGKGLNIFEKLGTGISFQI